MPLDRRRLIFRFAAAAQAAAVPGLAQPASNTLWPTRAIIIVVPFPAGGSADLSARLLAEHLKTAFGQPVVVENKPGAGGNLAAAEVARAPADGHTLFIGTNGTQTINQSLYRQLPYDPVADFAAIGMMWSAPHLAAVNPAVPAQSLDAFIAYARAHPGELSYGSSGIGSSTHLFGELFKARTGISMVHVPYRGQGAALEDLIGGRIAAMFPIVPDVIASLRGGQVRALALATNSVSEILARRAAYAAAWLSRSRRFCLGRALRSGEEPRSGDRAAAHRTRCAACEQRICRAYEASRDRD